MIGLALTAIDVIQVVAASVAAMARGRPGGRKAQANVAQAAV